MIFAQWPNSIITTFSYHVTNAGAKSLFPPRDNNTGHGNSSCCKMVNKSLSVLQTSGNDLFYYFKKNHLYPFIRSTFGKCRRDFISSHSYKVHDQKGLKLWKQAEQLGRFYYLALFITPITEGDLHMTMPLSWAKKHYLQKPSL